MHMPFVVACILVLRQRGAIVEPSHSAPDYLAHELRGLAAGHWFSDSGCSCPRQFRALKGRHDYSQGAWPCPGLVAYHRANVEQADHLCAAVITSPTMGTACSGRSADCLFLFPSRGLRHQKLECIEQGDPDPTPRAGKSLRHRIPLCMEQHPACVSPSPITAAVRS